MNEQAKGHTSDAAMAATRQTTTAEPGASGVTGDSSGTSDSGSGVQTTTTPPAEAEAGKVSVPGEATDGSKATTQITPKTGPTSEGLQAAASTSKEAATAATDDEGAESPNRAERIALYATALESYDKSLVLIAGGALTLSVAFLHQIAPRPIAESLFALRIGWGGFVFCLGIHVLSMVVGHFALEADLREDNSNAKTLSRTTTLFNCLAVVSLLVGFIGLLWFSHQNIIVRSTEQPASSTPSPR